MKQATDDARDGALTLVIGNKNYSSWSLRPWLFLRHHGVPFTEHRIPLDTERFRQEIGLWSPAGRVPVLMSGELAVWDSLAILEFLAERFPAAHGWPEAADARAVARSVCAEMHAGFIALRAELPMDCRRHTPRDIATLTAATRTDITRIQNLWHDSRQRFGAHGPFLFGGFGIADCMYAPVAMRFVSHGVPLGDTAKAWVEALLALPAMQEWLADARAEVEVLADDH